MEARRLRKAIAVWVLAASCMAPAACISGTESIAADVSPEGWSEPVEMRYSNTDTLARKELGLALLHASVLAETGGRFVVEITSPTRNVTRDTLTVRILPVAGGNELMETRATPLEVCFSEEGDYLLTVTPLKRVYGVWSVGIDFN